MLSTVWPKVYHRVWVFDHTFKKVFLLCKEGDETPKQKSKLVLLRPAAVTSVAWCPRLAFMLVRTQAVRCPPTALLDASSCHICCDWMILCFLSNKNIFLGGKVFLMHQHDMHIETSTFCINGHLIYSDSGNLLPCYVSLWKSGMHSASQLWSGLYSHNH